MGDRRTEIKLALVFLVLGMLASLLLGNARFLNEAKSGAYLPDMVSGEAARPFVLRRLVPELVGIIPKVAPSIDQKVSSFINTFADNGFAIQPAQSTMHADVEIVRANRSQYFYLFLINGLFLGLFGYFFTLCLMKLFDSPFSQNFWITVASLASYSFFSPFTSPLPYDQATIAFVAMGLYGLVSGKMSWYWVALAVAPWNRETAVILPVMFLIVKWDKSAMAKLLGIAFVQIVYCLGVKQLIASWYVGNRGSNMVDKLQENLSYLINLKEPTLLPFLGIVVFLVWIHVKSWSQLPDLVRRLMIWIYPPVLLLHVFAGVLRETRAIVEIYPFLWMAGMVVITGFLSKMDAEKGLESS